MLKQIEAIIKKIVGDLIKISVVVSEKPEFGDYSTNVAFLLAKEETLRQAQGKSLRQAQGKSLRQAQGKSLRQAQGKSLRQSQGKKSPAEIAEDLVKKIKDSDKKGFFEKVESTGGFVNFWISSRVLVKELESILKKKTVGSGVKGQGLKVNLEFISANPTGPLTMANGRGGFLGDTLANVLEAAGHKVTREYYINDAGNQIRLLGDSILAVLGKVLERDDHYQGSYIKDLADSLKFKIISSAGEKKLDSEAIGRLAAGELLKQIQKSMKNAGINFDIFFSEYENLRKGDGIKNISEILEKKGLVEKKEGAIWLKTSDIADEKDRVLVKSDGQPTYFLADLAYHYDKFVKRKFGLAIDIWGADHHGYVARLASGVKALGIDSERLKIIITQLVRLVEDGKEVRISKRRGEFITLEELLKEVGRDAARFFFLMHTPESHMDFDLALAKEKSQKNPVYYAQYALVRCQGILQKLEVRGEKLGVKMNNLKLLNKDSEINLLVELVKFPDIVLQTAEDYQVSRLARYAMELARAVHNFYEKERVIDEKGEAAPERLALVAATAEILKRLFVLIGIDAPEKM